MMALAQQDTAGAFVDWGVIHVSVTNLLVVVGMLACFVLALVLPFPSHRAGAASPPQGVERPRPDLTPDDVVTDVR